MSGNQGKNLVKSETISLDLDSSLNLEVNEQIKQHTYIPVDKNNLKKVRQEYSNYISKNNIFCCKILPDVCLGFATTLIGAILSAAIGGIRFPDLLAYFCYCIFPPLSIIFLFVFVIIKVITNLKKDDFVRVTKEYILDQTGYEQSGEKDE